MRFRHVLVQEAVYRAAPKRLRAELHERLTDRFDSRRISPDLDEFVGYHLERAHGCGPSWASATGGPPDWPKTRGGDSATPVFVR